MISRTSRHVWLFPLVMFTSLRCSAEALTLDSADPADPADPVYPVDPTDPVRPVDRGPRVTVDFPAPHSLTDATFVVFRGRASDRDGVRAVRINGVLADTLDDFATWELSLPLSLGENTFIVTSEDQLGITGVDAARIVVTSEPLLSIEPRAVAIDDSTRRAFVIDAMRSGLIAIELDTGARTLISGDSKGSGHALHWPTELVIDTVRRRAIVVDLPPLPNPTDSVLVAIDLDTGDRTIISDATTGSGPEMTNPAGLILDHDENRVLLIESNYSAALLAIDLDTGDRMVISDPETGSGRPLINPSGLAWDASHSRVIVLLDTTGGAGLVAVDLTTGDRTSITNSGELGANFPDGIAIDAAHNRALIAANNMLVAIDLSTGVRTAISDRRTGDGPELGEALALSFDPETRRAWVLSRVDSGAPLSIPELRLFAVDVDTGARAFASVLTIGAGPAMRGLSAVTLDRANARALVLDYYNALMAVDLTSGDRSIVADPRVDSSFVYFGTDLTLDETNKRVFVVDGGQRALISIDLSTGEDMLVEGTGPELVHMTGVALDVERNRALLVGYPGGSLPSMLAVDLGNGVRSVLIDSDLETPANFFTLNGVAIDEAGAKALVTSARTETLYTLDLITGERVIIADEMIGTGPRMSAPGAVAFDAVQRRAIVMSGARLTAVNVDTGERTLVSDVDLGAGPTLSRASDIVKSSSPCCAWVIDEGLDALVLVDLISGQRVIASGHGPY